MAESILNYTPEELADHFSSKGIEGYRAKQVFAWVCGKDKNDFQGMTNLPQEICRKLSKEFVITTLTCLEKAVSKKDQTEKFLWDLGDGCYVETVLIRAKARRTICLSTQAGCRFGCPFCASGKQGFKRNLSAGEIVDEVLSVQRMNKERITNVV
ncbi:MAG: 23S rRNA (adenine(2503)-C(2))-methyltransferase RlmN, partial [Nitrosopumilaceae archaeon]